MREVRGFVELKDAESDFSGPDYLRAIFSLKRYSSLQGRSASRTTTNTSPTSSCDARRRTQTPE